MQKVLARPLVSLYGAMTAHLERGEMLFIIIKKPCKICGGFVPMDMRRTLCQNPECRRINKLNRNNISRRGFL